MQRIRHSTTPMRLAASAVDIGALGHEGIHPLGPDIDEREAALGGHQDGSEPGNRT
jgi:hypothetical protein